MVNEVPGSTPLQVRRMSRHSAELVEMRVVLQVDCDLQRNTVSRRERATRSDANRMERVIGGRVGANIGLLFNGSHFIPRTMMSAGVDYSLWLHDDGAHCLRNG